MNSKIGPKPVFQEEHLLRAIMVIKEKAPIGRKKISKEMKLGEGTTRTLLDQLKDRGLIKSNNRGHSLTDEGKSLAEEISKNMLHFDAGDLTVGEVDVAMVAGNDSSLNIKNGIDQRDEAIKAGAQGATVVKFEGGVLKMVDSRTEIDGEVTEEITEKLSLSDGDVIIIATGEDKNRAELGLFAAGKNLVDLIDF